MRLALAAFAALTLLMESAWSAGALPHIPKEAPYTEVVRRMRAAGFRPQPILKRPDDVIASCDYNLSKSCKRRPEVLMCAADGPCLYLFVRVSDGAPVLVGAYGDSEDTGAYPSYMGMRWPDASDWRDLDRLVIAGPKSHLRRPKP